MDETIVTAAIADGRTRESSQERVERLFEAHHQRLYRLARRMLAEPAEAQDLVQETFLRALRSPGSVPPEESAAEGWLVRVLVNLCRDWRRRVRVRERSEIPPPPAAAAPEDSAVARATVEALLARLSPRRRAVLVLAELEERSTEDVARLLGIARVTVRWHLSAARAALTRLIEEGSR